MMTVHEVSKLAGVSMPCDEVDRYVKNMYYYSEPLN